MILSFYLDTSIDVRQLPQSSTQDLRTLQDMKKDCKADLCSLFLDLQSGSSKSSKAYDPMAITLSLSHRADRQVAGRVVRRANQRPGFVVPRP